MEKLKCYRIALRFAAPHCPPFSTYDECAPPCQPTCARPNPTDANCAIFDNYAGCEDICVCDVGYVDGVHSG